MKVFSFLLAIVCVMMFSGCASIFSKSTYPVTITTNAPDANIYIRNAESGMVVKSGKSPLTANLPASKSFLSPASYQCEVKYKDQKQYLTISGSVDPWFFGNFILGGLIGMAIDGATGAAYKLDKSYYVHFSEFDK